MLPTTLYHTYSKALRLIVGVIVGVELELKLILGLRLELGLQAGVGAGVGILWDSGSLAPSKLPDPLSSLNLAGGRNSRSKGDDEFAKIRWEDEYVKWFRAIVGRDSFGRGDVSSGSDGMSGSGDCGGAVDDSHRLSVGCRGCVIVFMSYENVVLEFVSTFSRCLWKGVTDLSVTGAFNVCWHEDVFGRSCRG
jgi:hypothetical protein